MRRPCIDHDPGDEDLDDQIARWIETDPIVALCHVVERAGLTLKLNGIPISAEELRYASLESALVRVEKQERSRGW